MGSQPVLCGQDVRTLHKFLPKTNILFCNVTKLITQPFWPNKIVIDQERICSMAEKLHQRNVEYIYQPCFGCVQDRWLFGFVTPLP